MTTVDTIEIADIDSTVRIRSVDPAQVDALKDSIAAVGLLNPITVSPKDGGGYRLVAGGHRLAAARELGLVDVPARIVTLGEYELVIAECDENLCGPRLSPAEKAEFTARRKEAYLALHPDTAAGVAQAAGMNIAQERGGQLGHDVERFDAATSKATGQSERVVRRDAERGEKVIPEVIAMIKGTKLDTGVYLDKLKKLPPNEQVAAAKRDLAAGKRADAAEKKSAKPAKETAPPEADVEAEFDPLAVRAFVPDYGGLTADQRVAELEENVRTLEIEHAELMAEVKSYRDIKGMLDRGGPLEVIAAKDEEIRVLKERVYSESEDKIAAAKEVSDLKRKRDFWMGEAKRLGWKPAADKAAAPADYDEAFLAAVSGAEG